MHVKFLAAAALTAAAISNLAVAQEPAVAEGEALFKQCATCHAVGEGARNRVGPVLNGLFGRKAGTFEGYKYSPAVIAAGEGGLVWTSETLGAFVRAPRELVPGTKMSYGGMADETDIANLEAYLLTFSPDYMPAAPPPAAPAVPAQ